MKKLVLFTLLVMQVAFAWAQQTPAVKGKVIDSKTQKALQNVLATIQSTNQSTVTNALGEFIFPTAAEGNQILLIRSTGYLPQSFPIEIKKGQTLDLGIVVLEEDVTTEQRLALVVITDNDLGDDNSGSESTSGLLQASRDAYQQAAAFNWGQARFQIRGLDNQYGNTMINGIVMNKLYDGRPQWSNWGGLNDAMRNQEFTMGSAPSDYTFGGILGSQQISTRASYYRPGARVSFSSTNTNYSWRSMGTYASGMNSKGWAFVVSGSRRWAEEGYFEGTDYGAVSLFASVEKRFNDSHSLNFTSIYAQNSRGKNSPNTDEVTDMAGIKYNSYWGWQDGKKRNSRDKDVQEPIMMLSHYWRMNEKTSLNTNVAYQTGTVGNSRIDFQGVNNPDPTYYRNLPSYYLSLYNNDPGYVLANDPSAYAPGGLGGIHTPDLVSASDPNVATFLDPNQRQVNWDGMYNANSKTDAKNSVYVLYEDRTDDTQWTANTILNSQIADNITLNAGGTFRHLKSHNHKYLLDLLGGQYYNDINTFGNNENQIESDLNNPGRTVGEGDSYGYNYNLYATAIDAFTQFKFTYRKFDFYLSQSYARNEYQREGLYRNGYYPSNSFGDSKKIAFDNFGFKGGLTYKLSGNHLFTFNGVRMTKAPTLRNTFPNARVNNNIVPGLRNETVSSADASYILRTPKVKARLTAFYSKIENATETSFFFADGVTIDDGNPDAADETSNFVAETVTGIDKKNIGAEFGIEYQVTSTIKATATASYGEYTYDNNPNVALTVDAQGSSFNLAPVTNYGEAKIKNYYQAGMPQKAASFGLEYRDPHFWWIGANVNYLADRYLDIAPILRTDNFFKNPESTNGNPFPEATEERARQLLKQEKFDDLTLVNLSGGKSWKIGKQMIGFFASLNNVFDIKYKTGGYEQARNASYRELNQDVSSGTPAFAPKYFYGYGRTYFVNLYINF
ncbi:MULTISPECIES: TonB-dependent receptor [Flavobacterium]|uniref:TonB-dependent receptor n=1 Tax=Flavobacterium TaxID=237 RepID=UPI001FCAFDE0|nr:MULTISPECIES: TonB-dependent receptor [Flavobacterium]UOK43083.1 TonB-dependent receptor [Flavobacterium enshiense]